MTGAEQAAFSRVQISWQCPSMNQKSSVGQTLKSVRWLLTSDTPEAYGGNASGDLGHGLDRTWCNQHCHPEAMVALTSEPG